MPEAFEVAESFRFLGRTVEEYRRMFGLDLDELAGQRVLDCPGGPSSFTAVAADLSAATRAVDPMYGPPVAELETVCREAVERTVSQLHEKRDLFVWEEYGDVATRGRYLRAAAERFLTDYARRPGRYLRAGLPSLPFPANAFDTVLSGNLLFLYDDRLGRAFHLDSLWELARVASEEVRVFPLHSLDAGRSRFVDDAVDSLREAGLSVRFESVPYEFQPGATEALVVRETRDVR